MSRTLSCNQPSVAQQIANPASAEINATPLNVLLRAYAPVGLLCAIVVTWLASVVCGVHPVSPTPESLLAWGAIATSVIQAGQWWRLVTAIFMHAGIAHLALNGITLWWVGRFALRYVDNPTLIVIFVVSGMVANAIALHFGLQTHIGVGTSAAVLGLIGALLPILLRKGVYGKELRLGVSLTVLAICSVGIGYFRNDIEQSAHVGGLLTGLIIGFALRQQRQPVTLKYLVLCSMIGLLITGLIAATAPTARRDMARYYSDLHAWRTLQPSVARALGQLDRDINAFRSQQITQKEMLGRMEAQDYPAMQQLALELSSLQLPQEELIGKKSAAMARLVDALQKLMEAEIGYSKTPSPEREMSIRECANQVKLARESLDKVIKLEKVHSVGP